LLLISCFLVEGPADVEETVTNAEIETFGRQNLRQIPSLDGEVSQDENNNESSDESKIIKRNFYFFLVFKYL